jgi:hypothetical protein
VLEPLGGIVAVSDIGELGAMVGASEGTPGGTVSSVATGGRVTSSAADFLRCSRFSKKDVRPSARSGWAASSSSSLGGEPASSARRNSAMISLRRESEEFLLMEPTSIKGEMDESNCRRILLALQINLAQEYCSSQM